MARRLLVIDGDDGVRATLSEQLLGQKEFAEIVEAVTIADGLRMAAERGPFDLIMLGVDPAKGDCRAVIRALRDAGDGTPVILLADAADEDAAIAGLDAGADDYLIRPFRLGVLLARVRAHIRRREAGDGATATVGVYAFHPEARTLTGTNGELIHLTEKEAAILRLLIRADGATIGRERLLEEVWGYNAEITTHTLETHIYRLRQKIESDPTRAAILLTEEGGYRLASAAASGASRSS